MKKLIIILTAVVIAAAGGLFFRDRYVYLENSFIERRSENIDVSLDKVKISELNRCKQVSSMIATDASNESLSELTAFEYLDTLEIFKAKEEISAGGISAINNQPALRHLGFTYSKVDLDGISSNTVGKLIISSSSVKNLHCAANCGILKKLTLNSSKVEGCIVSEENPSDNNEPYNYYLRDTSELLALNNIEELDLYNIHIEDVSGFEYMDSLKKLSVSEGYISNKDKQTLEDKGIQVILKDNDIE